MRTLVIWLVVAPFLTGCYQDRQATRTGDVEDSRSWDLSYKETLRIRTEPSGAKVYIQEAYSGTSPQIVTIDCGKLVVQQKGTYSTSQDYTYKVAVAPFDPSGERSPKTDHRYGPVKRHPTTWDKNLIIGGIKTGSITINTVLDGYKTAIRVISFSNNSDSFKKAVSQLQVEDKDDSGYLPSLVTGVRDVLIVLDPTESPIAKPQQQQQQQQQAIVIQGPGKDSQETLGTVIVTADVEGADILVDGLFVGNAPANLKLKEGVHIIEVKKGGASWKREVRVLGNSDVNLRALLK